MLLNHVLQSTTLKAVFLYFLCILLSISALFSCFLFLTVCSLSYSLKGKITSLYVFPPQIMSIVYPSYIIYSAPSSRPFPLSLYLLSPSVPRPLSLRPFFSHIFTEVIKSYRLSIVNYLLSCHRGFRLLVSQFSNHPEHNDF
jgi:hypothetical protein